MLQLPLDIRLDDTLRLENFYQGDNTQLIEKISKIDQSSGDFIFVWGEENSGKSHLSQAVCRELSTLNLTVAYFPLNNAQLQPEVLEGLEFADAVCIDSIDSICGDRLWEESIFNLYNNLKIHQRAFIIFAGNSPQNLALNIADLKSRLNSMEIYRLAPLDDEEKISFIISMSKNLGLDVSHDVAKFILHRTTRSIENLVDLVNLLDTQSIAKQRKITIPFVKSILSIQT